MAPKEKTKRCEKCCDRFPASEIFRVREDNLCRACGLIEIELWNNLVETWNHLVRKA